MLYQSAKRFAFVLSSALALFSSLAAAQNASPNGSYGFLISASTNAPFDNDGAALLGVMNLDGAGNITLAGTSASARLSGEPRTRALNGTGTYTVNSDGTGTVNLNSNIGILTFAAVVTDGGQGIQLVLTQGTGAANNLGGGNIVMTGSPQTLTGSIPMALFVNGASGGINLSLKGVSSGNATIYSASPGSSTGAIQCPDGSSGTFTANLTAFTIVLASLLGGQGGDYLLAFTENGCGQTNQQLLTGQVTVGGSFPDNFSLLLSGSGTLFSGAARAGQVTSLSGSYGFSLGGSPIPVSQIGVMNFDGAGNVTASLSVVGPPGTSLNLPTSTTSLSGTYIVNPDGTGTITFTDPSGATAATFSFVTTDGGSQIQLLQTSRVGPAPTSVVFGTARMQ